MNRLFVLALILSAAAFGQDWASLDRQGEEAYTKGDLMEAVRVAKLAVQAAADPKQSARSLDRLGFFQFTSGDNKAGEASLRQALEIRKTKLGEDSLDYAESANDLALLCRDTNQLAEGHKLAEQSVAIRTRLLNRKDLLVAEALNTQGGIEALQGDYDHAIPNMEEARSIHESQIPPEYNEEFGTLCINLAGTYQRVGKYAKSEATFEKGLEVLRVKPGVNHPAYAASLVGYATLQADLGHYSKAEKLFDEAGKLLREQLGEQHPAYAAFLNNRGVLYTQLGAFATAEADYRKALELKRKLYPPDALTIGATLRNLAPVVYARNHQEGERLFKEDVDLYARNAKPPAFDYSSALLGLADAQRTRGDLAGARETLTRTFDVISRGLGTEHPLYAAALRDRGLVHQAAHEYPQAVEDLRAAIAIVEKTHGADHPDLAVYLSRLATVYEESGDYPSATPLYRRSLDISDRTLSDLLTVGSESGKARVLTGLEDPVPGLIAFQNRAKTREARELAFEAIARRKGRVLDAVHDWGQSLRENTDATVRHRLDQRASMVECEASLTVALGYRDLKPAVVGTCDLPGTDLEGRYEKLLHELRTSWTEAKGREALQAVSVLRQKIGEMEAQLSRELPQLASALRPVTIADIRSGLAPDETLVEFVQYQGRYGAFIVTHTGLQWADLGPSRAIDQSVKDLFAASADWSTASSKQEARNKQSAEHTAQEALNVLSTKLSPALASVATPRLRVSPDGMLNLVPFAALSDTHGDYLIKRYEIGYLGAARDLVPTPTSARPVQHSMYIAVSPGAGSKPAPTTLAASTFRAERLERLEDAEIEARAVQKWLPKAQLLGEHEATEQRIKQLHRPAVLHIVGHGIVRGDEDCSANPAVMTANDNPGCQLKNLDAASRVMNLSAMVLEEAYGRGGNSSQDGMLTALELQTLDFEGTELLVLSQCRMADGVPSSGEGVFGMRRAAEIAGVKTFVAPLWKVDDAAEQTIMNRFYSELSSGKRRTDALRQAQLQLLKSKDRSSFLEWAPVILSGDASPLPRDLFTH